MGVPGGLFAQENSELRIDPPFAGNQAETSPRSNEPFQTTVESARKGSSSALGTLFEECRKYLLLVANRQLGESIQAKVAASDLVQETFLQAQQVFGRFEGTNREELLAWLKRILDFKLAQQRARLRRRRCEPFSANCRSTSSNETSTWIAVARTSRRPIRPFKHPRSGNDFGRPSTGFLPITDWQSNFAIYSSSRLPSSATHSTDRPRPPGWFGFERLASWKPS